MSIEIDVGENEKEGRIFVKESDEVHFMKGEHEN